MKSYTSPPMQSAQGHFNIEFEQPMEIGCVKVIRRTWNQPIDLCSVGQDHHLQLSLLTFSPMAEACFPDIWSERRFEQLGEVFLIPAGHKMRAVSQCRNQNSIFFRFTPDAVSSWFRHDIEWTDAQLTRALNITSSRVQRLILDIAQELRSPGFASKTLIELMCSQLLVELYRYVRGREWGEDTETGQGGLSPGNLNRIEQRIRDNPQPPSLTELADLCNLSVRQLTRAFRNSRGQTIGRYIADHRIVEAKKLLLSDMSIKAVAYKVGFSAPSNFTTAFVKATGETPQTFRSMKRKSLRVEH